MPTLRPGQPLRCLSSRMTCHVLSMISEGGQGEVYKVDFNGQFFALKWYNDIVLRVDRGLRSRLRVAVDRGAPSSKFLWPFELVTLPDGSRLGYLMRLRREEYAKMHMLLGDKIKPSFRALATTSCLLTDALYALHSKGLAYQDLNAGNVFFDPVSGDIEICDNDNVDISGAPSVMGGVWEFQAPEVILRQTGPTRATDLHSLAVMLFRILHVGHPLLGRRVLAHPNLSDEGAMRRLYATEARFVFDPADDSNRPLPDEHGPVLGHWSIYPQFVRDLFTRAFTEGLHDPVHGRVQETEWRRAMSRLHDSVMTCPHCSAENFYDSHRLAAKLPGYACWSCAADLPSAPSRIGIRPAASRAGETPLNVVVLEAGARLFRHHTAGGGYDFDAVAGEVSEDGTVLRNLSNHDWVVVQNNATRSVPPGEGVPLARDVRIRFERTEGDIKV